VSTERHDEPGTPARARGWRFHFRWGKGGGVFGERERRRERDQQRERDRERERERARRGDASISLAQPLVRPAPRSAMFFPLVVLVAVLPGLYALNSWDLTPPGPWWGLRGLAVLDGHVFDQTAAAARITPVFEAAAFRTVASQPPLYAWLEAVGLALSPDHNPLATVLPSYAAGVAVVVLVYLHGRLWGGPGLGLVAAVLTGFNRHLLVQMQQATPTTLALAGALAALYGYAAHLRRGIGASTAGPWDWARGGPFAWGVPAGLALGLSLMSIGLFGWSVVPVVLLHQAYLAAGALGESATADRPATPPHRRGPRWRRWLAAVPASPSLQAGVVAVVVAAAVAAPWHVAMIQAHGSDALAALLAPFDASARDRPRLLGWLIRLAPATLPLGLFGATRAARRALADEGDTDDPLTLGGAFWVLWLAAACVLPAFWPMLPRHLGGLFLLVPLNLLAAAAVTDLASRRIRVRTLTWLAPATAFTVVWSASDSLSGALGDLLDHEGRLDSNTALGLHLALDLVVAAIWLTHVLDRWARRRDDRQRRVLAGFLLAVLAVTIVAGAREVRFRNKETVDLLMLRTMILRHDREHPFTQVDVIGPEIFNQAGDADGPVPGGRLRFILRTALPHLPQRDLASTDDLLKLPDADAANVQRLVILAGRDQGLPYPVQSRLKLEAIYPGGGVLNAFATAHEAPAAKR
jgi:Dolichyl-phosphate-mannose-protein mannosyltransferase